jgi:hypothetical protein
MLDAGGGRTDQDHLDQDAGRTPNAPQGGRRSIGS